MQKNVIRIVIIVAIIGILAGIAIAWYAKNVSRGTSVEQIKMHADSVVIVKTQIKAIREREIVLLAKLYRDSIKNADVLNRQRITINRLVKKLADTRPEVQAQIDSLPAVDAFVDTQDSLIVQQSSQIDSLESQKSKTWQAFNRILTASEDKYKMSEELNKHLAKINEIQADELVKRKGQNVGLKIGIVVLAVLAILK